MCELWRLCWDLCLLAAPAAAQEQRASIEGTVKDNTGAVLPGVTVDAKNLSQGGVASAVSDAGGFFRFPSLAPGAYEVTAKLSGFTPRTFSRVELTLGQTKVLDVALGVSGLSETRPGHVRAAAHRRQEQPALLQHHGRTVREAAEEP